MKAGGGNPKGAAWERTCSKRLSLWVTKGRRDDVLWRTAMSGGRATFQLRKDIVNQAQAGDITAISAEGIALCERCLFECKHYADLNYTALLTKGVGTLAAFWEATRKTAQRLDRVPVLIAKQNRYPAIVLAGAGHGLFLGGPWATLPRLDAELFWFEPVTEVLRPRLVRPNAIRKAAE
jgi:hypothetical protein